MFSEEAFIRELMTGNKVTENYTQPTSKILTSTGDSQRIDSSWLRNTEVVTSTNALKCMMEHYVPPCFVFLYQTW